MSSTSKTPILGLTQYIGSERFKRVDYNSDMLNIEKYAETINKFREEFKDNKLDTFTTDQMITPLTNCVGGMVNIDSIQGKTRYKKADGTFTDTWESGVSLISVGENNENKIAIYSKKTDETIGDKTEILTTQPLRQWDSIDNSGVKTIGSGQIVLNGSENWVLDGTLTNTLRFSLTTPKKSIYNSCISDKFKFTPDYNLDSEHIYNGTEFMVFINKSRLVTQNVVGFKTWLSQNPTTVVYQLATPTTENTNKTLDLTAYQNGSLIVNSGLVNPTLTYSYARNQGEREFSIEDALGRIRHNLETCLASKDDARILTILVGQLIDTNLKVAQTQNVSEALIKELTDTKLQIIDLKTKLGGV